MRRRTLIRRLSLGAIGMTGVTALAEAMAGGMRPGERMPALFVGRTSEHYLPLLYALALRDDGEPITCFTEAPAMGSISMRSLRIG